MPDDRLVVVRTFFDRFEADVAQSALEAAGIEAMIRSDDCAGLRPHMSMTNGVELLVREADVERATEVLTELAHAPEQE